MEYEKAIAILKNLLNKHSINDEEKDAIMTAIGMLSLVSLSKNKIKALKAKREQNIKW